MTEIQKLKEENQKLREVATLATIFIDQYGPCPEGTCTQPSCQTLRELQAALKRMWTR